MPRVEARVISRGVQGVASGAATVVLPPDYWPSQRTVLFLSGCRWSATGGAQRPVALARVFSQRGWSVLYYNWMQESFWAGGPLSVSRAQMEAMLPMLRSIKGLCVCGLPSSLYYDLARDLQRAGWCLAYDVIDNWEGFAAVGDATWYKAECELAFAAEADLLTCSAPPLQEKMIRWTGREPVVIRNAGPSKPLPACAPPKDMHFGQGGTIVYTGYLWGKWFDWDLLKRTVAEMPRCEFNIVGAKDRLLLPQAPNLHFLGERPYRTCMQYVQHADAAIVPFMGAGVCSGVDPLKYYDHQAAGIPTVATACLSDMQGRPNVVMAAPGAKSLAPAIRRALRLGRWPKAQIAEWLADNSWEVRQKTFETLFAEWMEGSRERTVL